MGRFYQTARPKFIDHIYQPDQNLQLAQAKAEIEEDALMKSLASNAELGIKPTFNAWQGQMDSEVNALNEEIEPLVQELMTEGTNAKTIRKLNDLKRKAQTAYSSGGIGQMSRHYDKFNADYAEQLEMAKKLPADERAAEMSRLANWRAHVANKAGGGYEDFSYSGYSNNVDATKYLSENLDAETLKSTQSYIKKQAAPQLDGKILTDAEFRKKGGVFDSSSNSYYIPDGVDEQGNPKYKDITLRSGDIEWKSQFPFQYDATKITEEGYDQGLIKLIGQNMLGNNQAVFDMYAQDYRDFGKKQYFDQATQKYVKADDAYDYASKMIANKANEYASRFAGTTKEEELISKENIYGRQMAIKAYTHQLSKQENYQPLITQSFDSSSTLKYTKWGRESLNKYEQEKANYFDGIVTKIFSPEQLGLPAGATDEDFKKAYANASEPRRRVLREAAIKTVEENKNNPKFKKYHDALVRMEEKLIDMSTYGTEEFREVIERIDPENPNKTLEDALKYIQNPASVAMVNRARGNWELDKGVYLDVDSNGNAAALTNNEILGKKFKIPGFDNKVDGKKINYRIAAINNEETIVSPMDFKTDGGGLKAMGAAGTVELVIMGEDMYNEYQKYLTDAGQSQQTAGEKTLQDYLNTPIGIKFKDKMQIIPVTKYVPEYSTNVIIQ